MPLSPGTRHRRRRWPTVALAAALVLLTVTVPPAGAAATGTYLDVAYSGSFSSGNAYTAATGETMGGNLTRRSGAETLEPGRGLLLGGGRDGAGFEPAGLSLGDTTIDEGFVAEIVFTPGDTQAPLATVLAVGGNLGVRYQDGALRYGYDTFVDGRWVSRARTAEPPSPGEQHVLSVAYLPEGDGARMLAYLDGTQLPTVTPDGGRAALAGGRSELVGIGNDVHPEALGRGFAGSVGKTRFTTVTGPFDPDMFAYQKVPGETRTMLHTSFSGGLDGTAYRTGLGEIVEGSLTVTGGHVTSPGSVVLAGEGSAVRWSLAPLGEQPLSRSLLTEVVAGPDLLASKSTVTDLGGAIRVEATGERTVRLVAGAHDATYELGEPGTRDGVPYHHLVLHSDLDGNGDGTVRLHEGGEPLGEPMTVTGVTASRGDLTIGAGGRGTVYGIAVTSGGDTGEARLGRLPCTTPRLGTADRVAITSGECAPSLLSKASSLRPTERQVSWQEAERTAFLHFGMNTFTGNEWGHGDEDPELFQPAELDTDQWARVLADNGFRYAILTVKHHDGFVLYPSRYTDHDVTASSWRGGRGDVLREFVDSAHRYGLKVGVYLSPSDWSQYHKGVFANGSAKTPRTIPTLVPGDDRAGEGLPTFTYDATDYGGYFLNQLYEVLTEYGPVDEVWFDGADGGIPGADREKYDFTAYYDLIRKLAPEATIAVTGPDVRWVGNENGLARENEWSTVAVGTTERGDQYVVPSGQAPEIGTDPALVAAGEEGASELVWWPAEVDVSIRPGWFHHDDQRPKSVEHLRDIYYSSVGRNSVLLLNIPPDRSGRLPEADVTRLSEWNARLRQDMPADLALGADVRVQGGPAPGVTDGDGRTSHVVDAGTPVEVVFDGPTTVDRLSFGEDIADGGQQVRGVAVDVRAGDGSWQQVATTGTVGYKRILALPEPVTTEALRVRVTSARGPVHLATVSAYASTTEPVPPPSTYHVDCDAERAGPGTAEAPLNGLGQLRGLNLPAGSTVLLKRGSTCEGPLEVWGYGTDERPARLGVYGKGAPPALPEGATALPELRERGWVTDPVLNASAHLPASRP